MTIKNLLTASEMNEAYQIIVGGLFDNNDEYQYQYADFIIRRVVITYYTDIVMPNSLEESYSLCYEKELWDMIMSGINSDQYVHLINAVNSYVSDKKKMLNTTVPYRDLIADLNDIVYAVNNLNELPNWLADKDDISESPLLKKG